MAKPIPPASEIASIPAEGGGGFNRLIHSKSPYLLQHASNPVDWYPWSEEAFARAKRDDKPAFVSVGYSSCHWCHVMEEDSFEREDVADILNENFVSIKVDREERPDLDETFMTATQLATGTGGWPNQVWLTPDGRPWYASTFMPREDEPGRPGFKSLLRRLALAWKTRRAEVEKQADELSSALKSAAAVAQLEPAGELDRTLVEAAVGAFRETFDGRCGGTRGAPKFPPHQALRLLFHEYRRTGDKKLLDMAKLTLDGMARGGIRDHVGGGFHRYSTDERWFVPHFEKMLYDNALLVRAYADAYIETEDENYKGVAEQTCDWALREMAGAGGGFFTAVDADSDGEEGKFYVWTEGEIIDVLGKSEGDLFCRAYGVESAGNWRDEAPGRRPTNILYLPKPPEALAAELKLPGAALRGRLGRSRRLLFDRRSRRPAPRVDDKVVAALNGLMISALAYAGRTLNRADYVAAARRAAEFVLGNMRDGDKLFHTWREGVAEVRPFVDDYAFFADGLIELWEAADERRWLDEARRLLGVMVYDYYDGEAGGFFYAASTAADVLHRLKDVFDKAVPSGNAAAVTALVRLAHATGDRRCLEPAGRTLEVLAGLMKKAPSGTQGLALAAASFLDEEGDFADGVSAERAVPLTRGALHAARSGPVSVEAVISRPKAPPGGRLEIPIRVTIDKGWHINSHAPREKYLKATTVTLRDSAAATLDFVDYPDGETVTLPWAAEPLSVYRGTADMTAALRISDNAPVGEVTIEFELHVQPCSVKACLAAETIVLPLEVEINPAAQSAGERD